MINIRRRIGAGMSRENTLYIDSLRGLAALNVFLFHCLLVFFPAATRLDAPHQGIVQQWFRNSPANILANGNLAVTLFFVMSGYVLTKIYFDTGDAAHLSRRAAGRYFRLVIPAAASVLLVLFLQTTNAYSTSEFFAAAGLDAYNVGLPGAQALPELLPVLKNALVNTWVKLPFPTETYNQVLWTMPIEFIGSFIAFGLALIVAPLRARVLLCLAVPFALTLWGGIWGAQFAAFPVGVALAARRHTQRVNPYVWWLVFIVGLYLAGRNKGVLYDWVEMIPRAPTGAGNVMVAINVIGVSLVFWAVLHSPKMQTLLTIRPLVYFGRLSFSLYLVHQPLLLCVGCAVAAVLLKSGVAYVPAAIIAMAAAFVASIALGHAFMVLFDGPAVRLGRWVGNLALQRPEPDHAGSAAAFSIRTSSTSSLIPTAAVSNGTNTPSLSNTSPRSRASSAVAR